MRIVVNGDPREVSDGASGRDLLEALGLTAEPLAVERNGEAFTREAFAACELHEGDVVEILRFVGGG